MDLKQFASIGMSVMLLVGMTGCGEKVKVSQLWAPKATPTAVVEADDADAWMREGEYAPCPADIRERIAKAINAVDSLKTYTLGLYQDERGDMLQFDGEVYDHDVHLSLRQGQQEVDQEFFLVKDRFYIQSDRGLQDHGPGSRATGEKLYLPLFKDTRVAMMQAMNGEYKDLGLTDYNGIAVRKYDFRGQEPDREAKVITATIEVDEARGVLTHAVVGNGTGSDSFRQRFAKRYREVVIADIDATEPVALPEGVPILKYEAPEDDLEQSKPVLR